MLKLLLNRVSLLSKPIKFSNQTYYFTHKQILKFCSQNQFQNQKKSDPEPNKTTFEKTSNQDIINQQNQQKQENSVLQNHETQQNLNNQNQPQQQYIYDLKAFQTVNNEEFLERIRKLEQRNNKQQEKFALEGFKFPILLIAFSLFIYYQWSNTPYGIVYRHASISEYIPKHNHYHAVFLGALSFQNQGHLLVYFPALVIGLFQTSRFFKQRHMFYLFFSNSILTYLVTYYSERNRPGPSKMITPKIHGGVTSLAFISAFFAMKPNHLLLGSRFMPFFLIPAFFLMYEIHEYQQGYINEICRPAHLTAIIYGLVFGFLFKRFSPIPL